MSIIETVPQVTSKVASFNIRTNDIDIQYRPTNAFAHVNAEQVLKIIAKADIFTTAENTRGKVNFKLALTSDKGVKNAGFLNYIKNDLTDESTKTEVNAVLKEVRATLDTVEIGDISLPMTAGEVDDLIDNL